MDKSFWRRFSDSRSSDNLKSKIQNLKWVGFVAILVLLVGCVEMAEAQPPPKISRIGFLISGGPSTYSVGIETFRQALRELGHVEGKNIIIEWRYAEGKLDRLPALVAELVRLNVRVIVAPNTPASLAAKEVTKTIPIVMVLAGDPVGTGLIASLARPGGNVTGLTQITPELVGKRLELLKETVPKLSRVAVLLDPTNPAHPVSFREMEAAAPLLGLQLHSFEVGALNELENAIETAIRGHVGAIAFMPQPLFTANLKRIVDLAAKSRQPAMYANRDYVEAGGLMSYGVNTSDLWRRAATYVDKILKGAKPADLPVERPMKFELFINLKAAKQIGLTIPPNVLARADRVIK